MKYSLLFVLVLVFSVFIISAQEDVSVYQGQYYENGSLQQGTFLFTFNVYDEKVNGNLVYSHTEEIETSEFGEWYVELEGVSSAASNPRKSYFMEILVDGKVQGRRRRLTQLNYVRKETNQTVVGKTVFNAPMNVTGEAYFKDLLVKGQRVCLENGVNCPSFSQESGFIERDPVFVSQNETIFKKINNVSEKFSNYYSKSNVDELLANKVSLSNISTVSSADIGVSSDWIVRGEGAISVNEKRLDSFVENKIFEAGLQNYVSRDDLNSRLEVIRSSLDDVDTILSDSDISSLGYIKGYTESDPLWTNQRNNYYTTSQVNDLLSNKISAAATISIADKEVEPWLPFVGEAITFNEDKLSSFVDKKILEVDLSKVDTTLSDNYYTKEEIDSSFENLNSDFGGGNVKSAVGINEPSNPEMGEFYYNFQEDKLMFYDGESWRKVLLEDKMPEDLGPEEIVEEDVEDEPEEEGVDSFVIFEDGSCAYDCVYDTWGDCTQVGGELVEGNCDGGSCCKKGEEYEQCSGECLYNWQKDQCEGEIVSIDEGSCSGAQSVCCVEKVVSSTSSEDSATEESTTEETQQVEEENATEEENGSSEISLDEPMEENVTKEAEENVTDKEESEIQEAEEEALEEEEGTEEEVEEAEEEVEEEPEEECREVCRDECEFEEVCEEVETCEEVCEPIGNSEKEKCEEECEVEEVCEEVETCEEVCEEECGIPSELFDIKMSLEENRLQDSRDLRAVVTYESFGTVPTPVELTFEIFDEGGNLVYFEKGNITVTVEEIRRYSFEDLVLQPGKYSFVFTTLYGAGVEDEFSQEFSITEKNFFEKSWNWLKGLF